ncbi:MAG: hypothetical protein ACYDD1_06800 [Caulobacteraceae bacterium]
MTPADHTELVERLRQHHNETATLPHDGNEAFRLAADALTAQAALIAEQAGEIGRMREAFREASTLFSEPAYLRELAAMSVGGPRARLLAEADDVERLRALSAAQN